MHSMAIKVNVSRNDQNLINQALKKAGYMAQKRKFHCTLGFIQNMIPETQSDSFGQKIVALLEEYMASYPLFYEVEKAEHLFGHVIALIPTAKSLACLKEVNSWLFQTVDKVSHNQWGLNIETKPPNYIAHMTLWRTRRLDSRFEELKGFAQTHPRYNLSEASYVIFNER